MLLMAFGVKLQFVFGQSITLNDNTVYRPITLMKTILLDYSLPQDFDASVSYYACTGFEYNNGYTDIRRSIFLTKAVRKMQIFYQVHYPRYIGNSSVSGYELQLKVLFHLRA